MRSRKFALFATGLIVAVAVWFVIAANHVPSPVPAISITVLAYTNITYSSSNAVFQGGWILAQVTLTNEGTVSVSYASWGTYPYGWVNAHTMTGSTNGYLAPPFIGGYTLVRPKSSVTFSASLPAGTLRWQCGFSVHAASIRELAVWRLLETRWGGDILKLPEWATEWPIRLLPDKTGPETDFKSDEFEVDIGPHSKSINR